MQISLRSRIARRLSTALVLLAMCLPGVARSAWPPDPLQNVPLCITPFSSNVTSVVSDGHGGAIVVWYEDRSGDYDVFARRVRFDGTPMWTANGVTAAVAPAGSTQVLPNAVSDGAGGIIVGWVDGRTVPSSLFFQRIDSTGTRKWAAGGVQAATSNSRQPAQLFLEPDGAGGVVAAWTTPLSGLSNDIYAQRFSSTGTLLWGANATALCTDPSDQFSPVVERSGAGNFVVAWEDSRTGFRTQIFGQSLTAAGAPQWAANGRALATSGDNAQNPMLVACGATDVMLFWDADTLGVGEIRGQRLSSTGAAVWAGFGVRMFPAGVSGLLGAVTDGASGAYLSVARTDPPTGNQPLWVQRVQSGGLVLFGPTGKRISTTSSNQFQPAMAPDNANGVMLTWLDDQRGLAPISDIFAQRIGPTGNLLWGWAGVPVCRAGNTGPGLSLASDGLGGAVIAWSDTRSSASPDVYAQGVDALGQLGAGVGVDPLPPPGATALARPAPNPLPHGRATIAYTLAASEHVQLRVLDPAGRVVSMLEDGDQGAGTHVATWDGTVNGQRLPPGLYLVHLLTPSKNEIRRLVLL